MEHVRMSLVPQEYILKFIVNEPLIKNNPKCVFFFHHNAFTVNL